MANELFADVQGQPLATKLLESALELQRLAPAYLFSGPDGVGRRLAALRFMEGVLSGGSQDPRERRRLEERNHPVALGLVLLDRREQRAILCPHLLYRGLPQPRPHRLCSSVSVNRPIQFRVHMHVRMHVRMHTHTTLVHALTTAAPQLALDFVELFPAKEPKRSIELNALNFELASEKAEE